MQEVYIVPLKKPDLRHLSRLSKKSNIQNYFFLKRMIDFFDNRYKCRKPGFLRGNIYTSCISMVLLDYFANKSNTFKKFSLSPSLPFPPWVSTSSDPGSQDRAINGTLSQKEQNKMKIVFCFSHGWRAWRDSGCQRKKQIRKQKKKYEKKCFLLFPMDGVPCVTLAVSGLAMLNLPPIRIPSMRLLFAYYQV